MKQHKFLFYALYFFLSFGCFALEVQNSDENYKTYKADSRITSFIKQSTVEVYRATPEKYVQTICNKINELASNDFEKAKLAHDVICVTIKYDASNFWAGTVPTQNWQNVLMTKTAVCEGYANLFLKYCEVLKIPCKKASGYARGVGTNILNETRFDSNHAWNIVKIEEKEYLVDCTWDSGYMSGKNAVQLYSTEYLFTKPEHFIYTHFPDDAQNQLLETPLTQEQFLDLPYFKPILFDVAQNGFENFKRITNTKDFVDIEYSLKNERYLTFTLKKLNGKALQAVNNTILTEEKIDSGKTVTRINFPEKGTYLVDVYYWKPGAKQGHSCAQFIFQSESGNSVKYPKLYTSSGENVKIIEPKFSPLKTSQTYEFKVQVTNKSVVSIFMGNTAVQLENDGNGNFAGEVTIPVGITKVSVGIANSPMARHELIASYSAN